MPLPADTCLELEIDIQALLSLVVDLPGGISISANLEFGKLPDLSLIAKAVLDQLAAALAGLKPFFCLLDLVLAVVDFVKAVPDSLGPPPDPTALFKAIKKVTKALACCLKLIPIISVPLMIVGLCRLIVACLRSLLNELEHMLTFQANIDVARNKAATLALDPLLLQGAALLEGSCDCAQSHLDLMLDVNKQALGPVNKFLDIINAFSGLIGLPELAPISASGDASALLAPLEAAVDTLDAFCNSIPV